MAIVTVRHYEPVRFADDPDDFRPASEIAIVCDPASLHVAIQYLEPNPALGTEGNPPQPPARIDLRALAGV
jgi:hypothetical protein